MRTPLLFAAVWCVIPLMAQGAKEQSDPTGITAVKQVPYQPAVSREPFLVLGDGSKSNTGDYVDDIAVRGCFRKEGKIFAIISDSRGNVRWLEVGYRFKDGMIAAIDDKSVTFHQWDPNSTNTNVFRKVVKTFKREEAKR